MRSQPRRLWLVVLMIVLIGSIAATTLAGAESVPDHDQDQITDSIDQCPAKPGGNKHDGCPSRYAISTSTHKPAKRIKKVIRNWKPWSQPTVPQVYIIMEEEQRRWGGPSLVNRIRCESRFNTNADNGTYEGLLQFGPIFNSMYSEKKKDRRVVYSTNSSRLAPVVKFITYDDKSHKRQIVNKIRQKIFVVRIGMLPKNLDYYSGGAKHGWAAVRTGQRAVSGNGPTTGWSCGL